MYNQRDIVLIPIPFTDLSRQKISTLIDDKHDLAQELHEPVT
jgi:hypothetical protein